MIVIKAQEARKTKALRCKHILKVYYYPFRWGENWNNTTFSTLFLKTLFRIYIENGIEGKERKEADQNNAK